MTRCTGRRATDAAFTLIEAVVALMVVSIIVAVAIPAFQGFHRSAQDRAAQAQIDRVVAAEQAFWETEGEYAAEAALLATLAPGPAPAAADPSAGITITLSEARAAVCLEQASASGTVFAVWESAAHGTYYGRGGAPSGACPDVPPAGYEPGGW